jgi:hypothetical protein
VVADHPAEPAQLFPLVGQVVAHVRGGRHAHRDRRWIHDYEHHGRAGNPSTDFVPDSIVDRFCLVGPASAHIDRLQELASIGADQFAVYLMHDDEEATLQAYGAQIIPALS